MKFTVSSSELLKAIEKLPNPKKHKYLPIIECCLFKIQAGKLSLTGTDLDNYVTIKLEILSDGDFDFCVDTKTLKQLLKALQMQPISFEYNADSSKIEIRSAHGKYAIGTEPAGDFPSFESGKVKARFQISSLAVHDIVSKCFCVGRDELRPAMTGVYMNASGQNLTSVATDAHKLAVQDSEISDFVLQSPAPEQKEISFIARKNALDVLIKIVPKIGKKFSPVSVTFEVGENGLVCNTDHCTIFSRFIDARYPDYKAVIPADNKNVLTIYRADLKSAISRLLIFANKMTQRITLNVSESQTEVMAESSDFDLSGSETIGSQLEGINIQIGFHGGYLTEILSRLKSDEVQIQMSSPSRGVLITGMSEQESNIKYLLMPVMLTN